MLTVDAIACNYDQQTVLQDLSFAVEPGEICCLLGPSGCGKTTALRAIAGFQALQQGSISLAGQQLSNSSAMLPPEQRQIGMVFQDYALFPHLSVRDNIAFGLHRQPRSEQARHVDRMLSLTQLQGCGDRYPAQLSGGQQQRVALARALAPQPKLLLLDEPFSNLDVELRRQLNLEVKDILKDLGTSAILVTHDQQEAFAFGDKIGLLHQGALQQWDTPQRLYHHPNNAFVANFIGRGTELVVTVIDANTVNSELGPIHSSQPHLKATDRPLKILLRPQDIVLNNDSTVAAIVSKKVFLGASTHYHLTLSSGTVFEAIFASHNDYPIGQELRISAAPAQLIVFDRDSVPNEKKSI